MLLPLYVGTFSLIVSYGLHTSFINSLVQKNKNIHANPIKSLRFGLCHTFTPRPWKHGFAFTPQAWRYDTNQTLSIKIQLKRMIYLQQELGRAWVCLPLGISLGLRPREIPRGRQTQALPRSCWRYIPDSLDNPLTEEDVRKLRELQKTKLPEIRWTF